MLVARRSGLGTCVASAATAEVGGEDYGHDRDPVAIADAPLRNSIAAFIGPM